MNRNFKMAKETPKAVFTCDICASVEEANSDFDVPNKDWHLVSLTILQTDHCKIIESKKVHIIGRMYLVCRSCMGNNWWWAATSNKEQEGLFKKLFGWLQLGAKK
jgi:hypothetical protein